MKHTTVQKSATTRKRATALNSIADQRRATALGPTAEEGPVAAPSPGPGLLTALDLRIGLCVLICFFVPTLLTQLGVSFVVGESHLEIIQRLTACFACLLCCQEGLDESRHASVIRLVITAVGGLVGMAVVALDLALGSNPWVLTLLVPVGVVATLVACKAVHVPYVNARIGALTFVIVASMLGGTARLWYALFRLVSTLFGAAVVVLVTWLFGLRADAR